jgi:hypothetical protein
MSDFVLDPEDVAARDADGRRIFADDGTDLSLLRAFRALTPAERLRRLQSMVNFVERVRESSRDDD